MSNYTTGNFWLADKGAEMTQNAIYLAELLYNEGFSENSIFAMLGNFETESHMNPGIWQNLDEGNTSLGYGLCQWTPSTKYIDWCNANNLEKSAMESAVARIVYEVDNGLQWQNRDGYTETFTEFKTSSEDISYLAQVYLSCYEGASVRPQQARSEQAVYWSTVITFDNNASKIESAVQWCINIANDDTHGYDQTSRWGLDYDCSSFVISGYEQSGIPVKTNGASNTSNIRSVFKTTGFSEVPNDLATLQRGDILLKEGEHVVMFIGDGKIVHASQNENGGITGGQTGDQTGKEICIRDYWDYPWDCVLRLPHKETPVPPEPTNEIKVGDNIICIANYKKSPFYLDTAILVSNKRGTVETVNTNTYTVTLSNRNYTLPKNIVKKL